MIVKSRAIKRARMPITPMFIPKGGRGVSIRPVMTTRIGSIERLNHRSRTRSATVRYRGLIDYLGEGCRERKALFVGPVCNARSARKRRRVRSFESRRRW